MAASEDFARRESARRPRPHQPSEMAPLGKKMESRRARKTVAGVEIPQAQRLEHEVRVDHELPDRSGTADQGKGAETS